ncbi:MAG TPA: metallophosphoesterase family protein [Caulobacteraceae bacterium]|nr:metallophosphoesterase family protein [Caulobacteraceae bacterium]
MDETPVAGRRFGLTADTHDDLVDWPAILAGLKTAWGGVDAVLHCGDITRETALDDLAAIAPVYATRSDGDPPAAPPRLAEGPRVLVAGGLRIGLTFSLPETAATAEGAAALFGGRVVACVFGGTHVAEVTERDGVLFVNPGSPSLAKTRSAAVLTLEGGRASAQIASIG